MRKLALAVGYSPAALYLYFASKEDLFEALAEESFLHLYEVLAGLTRESRKDPATRIREGLRMYVDWGLAHPHEYQIAFVVRTPERRPYRTHDAFEVARSLVQEALPDAAPREVEARTQALWAATHGITSLLIQRPSFPWVSKERLIGDVVDAAVRGALDLRARPKNERSRLHAKRN
jgi:AcrR family transcriptional regulator